MRLFAIKDSSNGEAGIIAILSCYAEERTYYIDMPRGADPWEVPLVLSSFASRGCWTIGPDWAGKWVDSRVVPQSRQNLGEVLKENGLDRYDTLRLLEMTNGRNSQDDCYLEPLRLAAAPEWFLARETARVADAVALDGFRLIVAFRTGDVRLYEFEELFGLDGNLARISSDEGRFSRVSLQVGGRGLRWGSTIAISDEALAKTGMLLPLTWNDLVRIAPTLLVDAGETAKALDCTRQNVNALVKRGSLAPVKSGDKTTLFLRADVLARRDQRIPGEKPAIRYAVIGG